MDLDRVLTSSIQVGLLSLCSQVKTRWMEGYREEVRRRRGEERDTRALSPMSVTSAVVLALREEVSVHTDHIHTDSRESS